jgi:hypothetical protein
MTGRSIFRPLFAIFVGAALQAGFASAQPLPHAWSQGFGDAYGQYGRCIVVADNGDIIIAGYYEGSINLGGGWLTSAGGFDIFLAKFDASGAHLWSRSFGSTGAQYPGGLDVLSNGQILLVGHFENTINFGTGTLTSHGSYDVFVAKFFPTGVSFWSRSFGDAAADYGRGVAQANGGMTYLVGDFSGSIDLGGGPLVSAGGVDIWHAELDGSNGAHLWSHSYGGPGNQLASGIAGHVQGRNTIIGSVEGSINCGGGVLTSAGGSDVLVASFDAGGNHRWSRLFGDAQNQYGTDAVIQMAMYDEHVVTGYFQGTINLGGGNLVSHGGNDIFLAKFDHNGVHRWSRSFGGPLDDYARGVSGKALGTIALTGQFQGTCDLGGGPLTSAGLNDVFVATYDDNGTHLTSQRHGDTGEQMGTDVCVGPSGEVAATGSFALTIDFGGGPLTSAGAFDVFAVKFGAYSQVSPSNLVERHVPGALRLVFDPLSSTLRIPYSLEHEGRVRLDIHDAQGRLLETLVDRILPAGDHEATWTLRPTAGRPAPTSIHFARLTTDGEVRVGKLIVMK